MREILGKAKTIRELLRRRVNLNVSAPICAALTGRRIPMRLTPVLTPPPG